MRVISGKYKGRNIQGYTMVNTRPTMDRLKESLFAMIQNRLKDSIVLDLFAGTGSLGIEALSNGAKSCYFIDQEKEAIEVIKKNTKGMEGCYIYQKEAKQALSMFQKENIKFDIILLDPPYHENLMNDTLQRIIDLSLLNDDGIIVCEYEEGEINVDLKCIRTKKYGSKHIQIFVK